MSRAGASLLISVTLACSSGCYQEVVVDPLIDPVVHCEEREFWLCQREVEAGRFDDARFEECQASIVCGDTVWPPDCLPTESEHERCVARLRDPALFAVDRLNFRQRFLDCELCL